MASSTNRRHRRLAESLLIVTPRDEAVLRSIWEMRCLTRDQIQRLHFGGKSGTPGALSSSICIRRLGLLHAYGYLAARRIPTQRRTGASPNLYSLGSKSAALLARRLDLAPEEVKRRIRKDRQLAWTFHEHRQSISDVRIALRLACENHNYRMTWVSDEEIAGYGEQVHTNGHTFPIRPDAFFVIELSAEGPRAAFFLELQHASDPGKFGHKARAYMAYQGSGAYNARFGHRSLRILAVVDSDRRAANLKQAAEQVGGATLFWSASLDAVEQDPFGPIWFVGGMQGRQRLFETTADRPRLIEASR